jgi:cell division septation protein DedD
MDQHLVSCIAQLLYTNDCVIVPQLGAFIVQQKSAEINLLTHQILPPRRSLLFNAKINNNDGLLASYLAEQENISYKSALERIALWVSKAKADLDSIGWVDLAQIGRLHLNPEGQLLFHALDTNFSLEAYGLSPIEAYPLVRQQRQTEPKLEPSPLPEPAQEVVLVSVNPVRSWGRWLQVAVVAGLLLAAPLLYQWTQHQSQANKNTGLAATQTTPNSTQQAGYSLPTPPPSPATPPKAAEPKEEEALAETHPAPGTKNYVIVIGAFADAANAKRQIKQLEDKGYFPDLAKTESGLHRVGIQITCTPKDLDLHLKTIRKKFHQKAWVVE